MDNDEKATLTRHLGAEAKHDAEGAAACYCPDGWYEHEALGLRFEGREAVRDQYALSYAAFPDLTFDVEEEIEAAHSVVQRGRLRGTFTEALLGVEPTGRRIDVPVTAFYDFRNGLIRSERIAMDLAVFADSAGVAVSDFQAAVGFDTVASRAWNAVSRYAEAKSRADIDAALAECTDDFELHTVAFGMTSSGITDTKADLDLWFTAFPDYDVSVDGHLATGRVVTCWGTIAATMHGDLGPLGATGSGYRLAFSCIFDIDDGRIRRERFHFDLADMATQLHLDLGEVLAVLDVEQPAA